MLCSQLCSVWNEHLHQSVISITKWRVRVEGQDRLEVSPRGHYRSFIHCDVVSLVLLQWWFYMNLLGHWVLLCTVNLFHSHTFAFHLEKNLLILQMNSGGRHEILQGTFHPLKYEADGIWFVKPNTEMWIHSLVNAYSCAAQINELHRESEGRDPRITLWHQRLWFGPFNICLAPFQTDKNTNSWQRHFIHLCFLSTFKLVILSHVMNVIQCERRRDVTLNKTCHWQDLSINTSLPSFAFVFQHSV